MFVFLLGGKKKTSLDETDFLIQEGLEVSKKIQASSLRVFLANLWCRVDVMMMCLEGNDDFCPPPHKACL